VEFGEAGGQFPKCLRTDGEMIIEFSHPFNAFRWQENMADWIFFTYSARVRREDELPVHPASAQHQC
jgi:hypothetical protein